MTYRVELPVFSGPLDLLLHLVKQQEVDIHDIRITSILDQYLEYLQVLEALDLNDLGDFLVMASTLMEIKSREMLPREDVEIEAELDPRDDLIRRLLEYKRYRDISRRLDRLAKRRARMVAAGLPLPSDLAEQHEVDEELLDLGEIEIWTLTATFARLLEETGQQQKSLNIGIDKRDVRHYTKRVLERVRGHGVVPFVDLFDPRDGRYGLIGAFIAILEMMKQGVLRAHQGVDSREIFVVYCGSMELTVDQILANPERLDEREQEPGDPEPGDPVESASQPVVEDASDQIG